MSEVGEPSNSLVSAVNDSVSASQDENTWLSYCIQIIFNFFSLALQDSKISLIIMKMKELDCPYWYLEIFMDYNEDGLPFKLSAELVKYFMTSILKSIFGEVASLSLDVFKFEKERRKIIIRVPSSNYAKVRAALTLCTGVMHNEKEVPLTFTVTQASSCLLSLSGPQRSIT